MFHFLALVISMGFQGDVPAGAPTVPLTGRCDASSEVVAQVPRDAAFQVQSSIDNAPTCYHVNVTVGGKQVQGYVVDRKLQAVIAFEHARVENEREAFKIPLPLPPSAMPPAPKEPEKVPVVAAKAPEKKVVKRTDVSM